ncbi:MULTISPECIES: hypothetical protein [Cysteiniphilum]|uniref:hypothetical protein n=1 Tax=Cysteiniphilum TaxID=2056696 RepID=UPI001782EF7A|nr:MULTISPECIES: hypothetical protein [Cysteiniphilum]
MANQYADSFRDYISRKYNKPVEQVLAIFSYRNMTYRDVAELTGYKETTVRKWCRYFDVQLYSDYEPSQHYSIDILSAIRSEKLSCDNVLFRPWRSQLSAKFYVKTAF